MHEKLVNLLALQKRCRQSESLRDLGFIAVNETYDVVYYKQALFWTQNKNSIEFQAISGNQIIDPNGGYARVVKKIIRDRQPDSSESSNQDSSLIYLNHEELSAYPSAGQNIRCSDIAFISLRDKDGEIIGGLWLERNTPLDEQEKLLLQEIAEIYSFFLEKHLIHKDRWFLSFSRQKKSVKIAILSALLVLCLFPVRLSVSAPAEIVARNPKIVTVPFDGVLENVLVSPGEEVSSGQIVASMEKTALRSELANSRESFKTVQSELAGTRRLAIGAPDKKSSLSLLKAEMALEKLEYNRARTRLDQSDIKAPKSGVAVFSDVNELEGKPVTTGERVMMIANTENKMLRIRVPARSMIDIYPEIPVRFYLSVSPFSAYKAEINSIGYQASPDPDGLLTYKVKASLDNRTKEKLRIGWQGTARVYGQWTVLSYAIFRQPLIFLRKVTGL